MNKNRFIVVGNGPSMQGANGVTGANEAYRTTEFQLLNDYLVNIHNKET